jgi:antitoxin (DNA-binding transcriptional repressor) of toxin-antitoxin stability system
MARATASVRDLRTRFPHVKELIAHEGEVIVTEHGRPSYVLRACTPEARSRGAVVDYWARLIRRQPKSLSARIRRGLDDANRGDR